MSDYEEEEEREEEKNEYGFVRNCRVESDAVEKLHYTVEQAKRRTISQLQRELQGYTQTGTHSPRATVATHTETLIMASAARTRT